MDRREKAPGVSEALLKNPDSLTLLRYPDLVDRQIVNNRMTLRRWMNRREDPFPRFIRLTSNGSVAWRLVEVEAWMERRAKAPDIARPSNLPKRTTVKQGRRRSRSRK